MPNDPLKSEKPACKEYRSEDKERKDNRWPEGYFDLFGSLKNETFVIPKDKPHSSDYPEGFFDLFGSLTDDPLEEPEELLWSLDAPRKAL
jgi:hypothetical protein